MDRTRIAALFIAVLLLLTACKNSTTSPSATEQESLTTGSVTPGTGTPGREQFVFTRENFPRMDGSTSTAPLAEAVACVLLGEPREDVADLVNFNRTTQSFRNLAAGLCDILIVSEPSPDVFSEMEAKGFKYEMAPIATEALVFIVNAANPVESLTIEQIQGIYTGKIANWRDVGGKDVEIVPFQRNAEAGSQVLMEKLVMDGLDMTAAPTQSVMTAFGMGELIEAMKGFDGSANSIGYTMYYYAEEMRMAEGLKIIAVGGVQPGAGTIRGGGYPFLNPYYVVIGAAEPEDSPARMMYEWLISSEGQDLINSEGYVSVSEPDMDRDVRTDYSQLTPYDPKSTMHSRLREGALTKLTPSADYGMLLPYTGSVVTLDGGSMQAVKYGLVTTDGMVVTDAIYDGIARACDYSAYTYYDAPTLPAYTLTINMPGADNWWFNQRLAACALDGSWITPFNYAEIQYSKDLIFLRHNYDSGADIDIYDYTGKRLYNMAELSVMNEVDLGMAYFSGIDSEGYAHTALRNGGIAFIDLLSGTYRTIGFDDASGFSDGYAAVGVWDTDTGLWRWGFINTDFELVLEPVYQYVRQFIDGIATVTMPDGEVCLIDKRGNKLLSVEYGYIDQNYDGSGFSVYDYNMDTTRFYTTDLLEIPMSTKYGICDHAYSIGGGWYQADCFEESLYNADGNNISARIGKVLFSQKEERLFPDVSYFSEVVGEYIVYTGENDRTGVMTLDGKEIVPPEMGVRITITGDDGAASAFVMNTSYYYYYEYERPISLSFKLFGTDGRVIASGSGILSYVEELGLYSILEEDRFTYMDKSGNIMISIPMMSYMLD